LRLELSEMNLNHIAAPVLTLNPEIH
jgi:hypothetical protein